MAVLRQLAAGGTGAVLALALTGLPAFAATAPTPRPATPAPARPLPVRPPVIYQVNPTKVNPTVQPNIMIIGSFLTSTTRVQVGGRPAVTVDVPDNYHLLAKLPDNLSKGTYGIQVTNEAGTAMASDALVIDTSSSDRSTLSMLVGGGLLALLVLLMRLARMPGLA